MIQRSYGYRTLEHNSQSQDVFVLKILLVVCILYCHQAGHWKMWIVLPNLVKIMSIMVWMMAMMVDAG